VSKRLNNLPNVAGAYWWVTQSLKRDMCFTTFKKLLCAERKRNPRWSANLNAAAAAASPPAPSPPAPPTPLEPAALDAPADFAATASAPHRVTCASDSVASVSASAGESSCVAGDLSPLPVDAEDLAAVSVGHQGAASDAVEAPRTPSMSRGASGKVLRMSPTCHRLPSMRAALLPATLRRSRPLCHSLLTWADAWATNCIDRGVCRPLANCRQAPVASRLC
jgi:hypothetical protein